MADTKIVKQIVDKITDSNNVLVTVNSNPSVDELSAALGITLLVNKLDKHATAVFSGDVPPAIEFLSPEKTFEQTVDSLRDFIIALDKEKADHLRYKLDGDMVKIYITPYRTTINQDDLDFSQGDYNVEMVLAIGVKSEDELDHALESHGRILHDATVAAISLGEPTKLGGIEWADNRASSYSEMLYTLAEQLGADKKLIDEQIANAFLTGIVAATDRFSNEKTSSSVMTIAAQLMSFGANQQLIASKLQEEQEISTPEEPASSDGDLKEGESTKIDRSDDAKSTDKTSDKDADGALSISHVPEGDVDEVAKEVSEQNSQEAASRAEEELAKQTREAEVDRQEDATEAAEKKLAEELAATAPAASTPTASDLQADIAKAQYPTEPTPAPAPLRGPVSADQWQSHTEQPTNEPMLGGTLNATTEEAAEESRRAIEDDRNKTILSHNGSSYASETPSFQSPLNATSAAVESEPEVHDIFGEGSDKPTEQVAAIQPPAPVNPAPTLAEIDAQARTAHDDARAAIDAALNEPALPQAPVTSVPPVAQTTQPLGSNLPPLPPLPPMPDFSTLPPLPGEMSAPQPSAGPTVPDTLGSTLPPAPVAEQPAQAYDPAQFRIPGQ